MPPVELDIPLRGARNYVHSTDLFHAVEQMGVCRISKGIWLRELVLRRPANRQVDAHFQYHDAACGTFELCHDGDAISGWLVESDRPCSRHISFDEAAIARCATVSQQQVVLPYPVPGHSRFEQAIVLLKLLAEQMGPGDWAFASVRLEHPFTAHGALEVVLEQSLLGRGFMAALMQGGAVMGKSMFVRRRAS